MQKETVVAIVRAEIKLSEEMHDFLTQFSNDEDAWFARDSGDVVLAEFGNEWNSNFVEITQSVIDAYFRGLGLAEEWLPRVKLTDSRRGSWIMEAALTMFGTIGTTYTVLKGLAELPRLADGLEETKKRLQKELSVRFKKKVPERIEPILHKATPTVTLPTKVISNPVQVACTIDARPLRGLTPDVARVASIHLSVAVSRSSVTVENLGDSPLENLQIGLFKSTSQKHSWSFGDAFSKTLLRLSGKQSMSLSIDQFTAEVSGAKLDLSDSSPLYVDCWLQDKSGIYLFNFFFE